MTQAELAVAMGPGTGASFVQRIERGAGGNFLPKKLRALERALGWQAGSVDDVLGGDHPTLKPERSAAEPADDITTVDAERAYEMLQSIRRVYGEEVYSEMLARAVRARMSGEDRKIG